MQVCAVLEDRIDAFRHIAGFQLIIADGFTAVGKAKDGAEFFNSGFSGVEVANGARGIDGKDQEKWDLRQG